MTASEVNRQFETQDGFSTAAAAFVDAGLCWVAVTGASVTGFAAVDAQAGSVEMLYVDPAAEGQRIGRALMRVALDQLVRLGHRSASLVTARDTRAERFYRAQGWSEAGDSGRGSVRMTKRI